VTLFVYGTLMDDALVTELTGQHFRKQAAALEGYRKFVPGGGYPCIVRDDSAQVEGFVLYDVDAASVRAFDRYEDEGRLYRRAEVVVTVAGRRQRVCAYVAVE
jgi:gamma-glutamylcyclotransferase (GGCT)/AIG2-like uncharacterized protein YtfP